MTNPDTNAPDYQRRIIHIDMDAFFASVEQRDNPQLKGKPVIVGGKPNSRGVVAACSYEARKFGVRSAMPCAQAARLCPNAEYIRPNIAKYRAVSQEIHAVFKHYTDLIEPLSLDEAYLDVTDYGLPATDIAQSIKDDIFQRVNLVASAGVSYNKFLAKLASDMDKPDGLFVIRPTRAEALVTSLPVRKFHGIGPATEAKMRQLGIETGADLKALSLAKLQKYFKSSAQYYFNIARGIDTRPVKPERKRVSMGNETTFANNITDETALLQKLVALALPLAESLDKKSLQAQTVTIKIKFADFKQITRAKTVNPVLELTQEALEPLFKALLAQAELRSRPVRLLGVTVSKLSPVLHQSMPIQLDLYSETHHR